MMGTLHTIPSGMTAPALTHGLPHPLAPAHTLSQSQAMSLTSSSGGIPSEAYFQTTPPPNMDMDMVASTSASFEMTADHEALTQQQQPPAGTMPMLYSPPSYPPPSPHTTIHLHQPQPHQLQLPYRDPAINPPMTTSMSQWFPAGNHFSGAPSTHMPVLPFSNYNFRMDGGISEDEEAGFY